MRIRPGQEIAGFPAADVRDACRRLSARDTCTAKQFAGWLWYMGDERELMEDLRSAGLVGVVPNTGGRWRLTQRGQRFCTASAMRPIHRWTAQRMLHEAIDRCRGLETWNHPYAYAPRRLLVFGSYVSDKMRLSDLDLAIEWQARFESTAEQVAYLKKRREVRRRAQRFHSLTEEMEWPLVEVRRVVVNRSRYISLHELSEEAALIEKLPHLVVFRTTEPVYPSPLKWELEKATRVVHFPTSPAPHGYSKSASRKRPPTERPSAVRR